MYRIRRFAIVQTATTVAAIYVFVIALFAIPAAIIVGLAASNDNGSASALGLLFFALIAAAIYGLIFWVITAIGCALYNLVAGWVGGIQLQIDAVAPPAPPPSWGPITQGAPPPSPPAPPTWGPTTPSDPPPSPPAPSV